MKIVTVIPARLKSSRFPSKPLTDILGKSMIQRTYQQCVKVQDPQYVFVATDSEEIKEHCEEQGMNVVMTSESCLTGTDRVAEVANKIQADCYINVQGDEPVIDIEDIRKVIEKAKEHPQAIINGYTEITSEEKWQSLSIPKVVVSESEDLIYMSRAAIPGNKDGVFQKSWRQVCVYAYPKDALERFSERQEKSTLEAIEDLEILRFLEMGYKVKMVPLSHTSIAVDYPEDVVKVVEYLKKMGERGKN